MTTEAPDDAMISEYGMGYVEAIKFVAMLRSHAVDLSKLADALDHGGNPTDIAAQLRVMAENIPHERLGNSDTLRQRTDELTRRWGTQTDAAYAVGLSQAEFHALRTRKRGLMRASDKTLNAINIRRIVLYELLPLPDETECARRLLETRRAKSRFADSTTHHPSPKPRPLSTEKRLRLEQHYLRKRMRGGGTTS